MEGKKIVNVYLGKHKYSIREMLCMKEMIGKWGGGGVEKERVWKIKGKKRKRERLGKEKEKGLKKKQKRGKE